MIKYLYSQSQNKNFSIKTQNFSLMILWSLNIYHKIISSFLSCVLFSVEKLIKDFICNLKRILIFYLFCIEWINKQMISVYINTKYNNASVHNLSEKSKQKSWKCFIFFQIKLCIFLWFKDVFFIIIIRYFLFILQLNNI